MGSWLQSGSHCANLCSQCSHPDRLLPCRPRRPTHRPVALRADARRCRSSARTATSTRGSCADDTPDRRPGGRARHPGPLPAADGSTARASPLEALGVRPLGDGVAEVADGRSDLAHLRRALPPVPGAPRRSCGSTTRCPRSSASSEPLGADTADAIYDQLVATPGRATRSGPGRSSTASASSSSPPPTAPSTPSRPTPRSGLSGWAGRVVPTFRPDDVVDPDRPDFGGNLDRARPT